MVPVSLHPISYRDDHGWNRRTDGNQMDALIGVSMFKEVIHATHQPAIKETQHRPRKVSLAGHGKFRTDAKAYRVKHNNNNN